MTTKEIDALIEGQDHPCVSIVMPADKPDTKNNYQVLKESIQKARALLKARPYAENIKNLLASKLDECIARIPHEGVHAGWGFYVSAKTVTMLSFPFVVKHKITVDDTFDLRDVIHLKQYATPYLVLSLGQTCAQLFRGVMNNLEEVNDDKFPVFYKHQFEYQRVIHANWSSGSSLNGFDKTRKGDSESRVKAAFREADTHLSTLLKNEDTQVLLAGAQNMIHAFQDITTLEHRVAGRIPRHFSDKDLAGLGNACWEAFIRFRKNDLAKAINDIQEHANGNLVKGVAQVWHAAVEGKGTTLMVETDLHQRAYIKQEPDKLLLQRPGKPYRVIPDAVDVIIKTVHAQKGKILFTENEKLKAFGRLAMVLRS